MRTFIALMAATAIIGCGKGTPAPAPAGKDAKPEPKLQPTSVSAKQVVEGMTGKTAVDQGKKAQAKIREISAGENKNLDEVLGK